VAGVLEPFLVSPYGWGAGCRQLRPSWCTTNSEQSKSDIRNSTTIKKNKNNFLHAPALGRDNVVGKHNYTLAWQLGLSPQCRRLSLLYRVVNRPGIPQHRPGKGAEKETTTASTPWQVSMWNGEMYNASLGVVDRNTTQRSRFNFYILP